MLKQALDKKLINFLDHSNSPYVEKTYLRKSYKEAKMIWEFITKIFNELSPKKLSDGYIIMINSDGYSTPDDKVNGFPHFKQFDFLKGNVSQNTITLVERIALDEGIFTSHIATKLIIEYIPPSRILGYDYEA